MDNGKSIWFYNAYDIASECFTCWVYGQSKESIILDFYRQLIRNYAEWRLNMPAELECEMSLNSSFKNTFLSEGLLFKHVKMEANNARGKYIERFFGELRYQYEKDKKGWLARPHSLRETNQAKKPIEQTPVLSFNEIITNSLRDIEEWNNRPHSLRPDKRRWDWKTLKQQFDISQEYAQSDF